MKLNSPLPQTLPKECSKAAKTFKSFVDGGNNGLDGVVPRSVLENAKGFAIFTIVKAGFLFSARGGAGLVIARLEDGSWSAPSAIGTAGVGFGGQAGAEMTDFLIVLNSRAAVRSFMAAGSLTLGGNLSIAVGPLGRNGEAIGSVNTSGKLAAMYSYSKTRGLFGGVSIEGSVILERQDANAQAYHRDASAKSLLSGAIPPPEWAQPLIRTLEACTGMPGRRRWVEELSARGGEDDYVFGGVGGPYGEVPPSAMSGAGDGGSPRLKKKERSLGLGWGKRKDSGSSFASEFHDPSRAPVPMDRRDSPPYGSSRAAEDGWSPHRARPATGYFETQFESDYISDERLRRHPHFDSPRVSGPDEYQHGSPFNSLPPFNAARSSLTGSDADSHRPSLSGYRANGNARNGHAYSQGDPFEPNDIDALDYGGGSRSLGSSYKQVKLAPKTELTKPLKPQEGIARAIALYNFKAVQPDDLSFTKGQVIVVTQKSQDTNTWWRGKLEGREGAFPANFVELV
ncbi:hypothetical protein BKA93DRAFT_789148 [Sparassis latifolia]